MNQPDKTLIIYGNGGHARSVADAALTSGITNIIFVDKDTVLPATAKDTAGIIAIGDNKIRAKVFAVTDNIISVIAGNAHIGKDAFIEHGVFVGCGAHIGPYARIGENTIINTHAVIEHDCVIGKHCHISVNATIAGSCEIGDFVMVGAGATVIDGVKIAAGVVIGAGAMVVKDILELGTYVGVPAIKIY